MATTIDYAARFAVPPAANADLNPTSVASVNITFSSEETGDIDGDGISGEIGDLTLDDPSTGLAFVADPDTWIQVNGTWYTFDVQFYGRVDHNHPGLYDKTGVGGPNFNDDILVQIQLSDGTLLFFYPDHQIDDYTTDIMDLFPTGGVPMDYADIPIFPPAICFVNGTLITSIDGEVSIEDLNFGDVIVTRDNGPQTISWIGKRSMSSNTPAHLLPIRIKTNALGDGLPKRDLLVSPQHRILVSDWRAELMFGASEVLIAAKHLVNDNNIRVATDLEEFEYYHILFESHQTVFSEGLPTESFHPGDMAIKSLSEESRAEVLELFPELANDMANYGPATHRSLKAFEAKALQSA